MQQQPRPGQRWISTSEPALGLGVVVEVPHGRVQIVFPAAEETRLYALENAPLVRVRFKPGDRIAAREGAEFTVTGVTETDGILHYEGADTPVDEGDLLDSLSFTSPEERLLAGLCDDYREFDLRRRVLKWNTRIRRSPVRGFCGARIDLIPHQLAIVSEACSRLHPRVMLADEVGLGKTIEACLILQHLHLTGRAERILILVPEPLIHQWFVELLRRFNLLFAIFDEARCRSITEHQPKANPFSDSQLILAPVPLLAESPERAKQARDAGFDLLIVDEAHHLEWSPDEVSPEYAVVEALAATTPSLLLLTATPQQLGPEGHFARLRLLDPDRYGDLAAFLGEAEAYAPLAETVEALKSGGMPEDLDAIAEHSPATRSLLDRLRGGDETARDELVSELIDGFGTGRVLFRNTRRQLTGFPGREPHLHPLEEGESPYSWLASLLRSLPEDEKVLLITGSPEAAIAVREKLLEEIHVESALFHEDLSLIQRDRNAAWFADPAGARILMSSEIGSEGRNFQFARHLVLFGLPRDPELLEQRIGRLDRIGQTGTIHIHVPYGVGSASEYQARWLHEGLDAFSHPLRGATTLAEELLPELDQVMQSLDAAAFDKLLKKSRKRCGEVAEQLDSGHDRLLELSAPAPEVAAGLIEQIEEHDEDASFERFVIRLFDRLGLDVSDLSTRTYQLARGQRLSEAFADLPDDGISATFDRETALAREDLQLLTADHPMVRGSVDHFLTSETGNATFARWESGLGKGILLEACFILETLAPGRLHLDRFLPPTAIRVALDHQGKDLTEAPKPAMLLPGDARRLVTQPAFRNGIFPEMIKQARALAEARTEEPLAKAREAAESRIRHDIDRLKDLAARNPQVTPDEIAGLEHFLDETLQALTSPRLRLDSLRVIWRT
ncbi:RNA polymerase-associated protein RapA [Haloferula helveola]|uniref:RNA polymerase-associated protein RapA n=1 Tax=Haloferula helveola TaxID=490095 RepID=A0ABM7RLS6_9BACT|nr:RNA polymerase-associated protein RapA [Haloferula helveola]